MSFKSNKKLNKLTAFTKEKLEILDTYMPGHYNFIKQNQERIDNIITNKNHPKYNCLNITDKYTFFGKWLKSFFKKLKTTNPSMYFLVKWKHYSVIKLKSNEDLELFIRHMVEKESVVVSEQFFKNIALSEFNLEGAEITTDEFTNEEHYYPIIVTTFNNYQNMINQTEIVDDVEIVINAYSIYATGLRRSNFLFSIENLNIENLSSDETNQNCQIEIIRKGINILKEYIKRTCKIRSIRNIHKL